MLSVKAKEATYTIFKDFGMAQLRIKSSLPRFAGERSTLKATTRSWQQTFEKEASSSTTTHFVTR